MLEATTTQPRIANVVPGACSNEQVYVSKKDLWEPPELPPPSTPLDYLYAAADRFTEALCGYTMMGATASHRWGDEWDTNDEKRLLNTVQLVPDSLTYAPYETIAVIIGLHGCAGHHGVGPKFWAWLRKAFETRAQTSR